MKEKIKTQKGFIQIPLLIWIVASLVTVSAVGTGVILYKQGKLKLTANVSNVFRSKIETPNVEPIEEDERIEESELTEEPIVEGEAEIEELKKKPDLVPVVVEKPTTPTTTPNNDLSSPIPLSIETWAELEAKYFISADQKGWTAQTITNALGEKRYYRKEGSQWVRKNSEAETLQPYVAPPTSEQLANVRRVCLWNAEVKAICDKPEFMPGYYNNIIFRSQIDIMFSNFLATMSDQQKQKIIAEKQTMDCLLAPSPEEERLLDPDTKMYLLQLRCGTVTAADRTNYELSRLKSSVDELKYRLDSKISFPSLLLDPIPLPISNTTRWQIRWEGSGGTITDSNGNFYQFYCEDNTCRSY
jgi:hypothetical protein